jgi:hypothetical protein
VIIVVIKGIQRKMLLKCYQSLKANVSQNTCGGLNGKLNKCHNERRIKTMGDMNCDFELTLLMALTIWDAVDSSRSDTDESLGLRRAVPVSRMIMMKLSSWTLEAKSTSRKRAIRVAKQTDKSGIAIPEL